MKRASIFLVFAAAMMAGAIPASAATTQQESAYHTMGTALTVLFVLLAVMVLGCVGITRLLLRTRKRSRRQIISGLCAAVYAVTVFVLVVTVLCTVRYRQTGSALMYAPGESSSQSTDGSTAATDPAESTAASTAAPTTQPTEAPTEPPTEPSFASEAGYTDDSDPDNWGVDWDIIAGGQLVSSYQRSETISFGLGSNYFALPGIATFRGDNYRSGASYGTASVVNETLTTLWERETSALQKSSIAGTGSWTGSGWTGQPLVVQWDAETRQIMNLYPEAKAKEDLVEVIYATLDGHVYFYDLETGEYTRDPLNLGMAFKGAGALDPRGYPLLYVGSGDLTADGKVPRMYVISLIDFSILYQRGYSEEYNLRSWRAFDSSPLVSAETDTLIWPGECGLLYTIKLNTEYDKEAGTISVSPDEPVMTRYSTSLDRTLGYEDSAVVVENYLYVADNGGVMFCVDLNTMELMWTQYTYDDTNATPIFEWGDDGQGYLYTGSSMEYNAGTVHIQKLDALTGEVIWDKAVSGIAYDKAVSGGVMSTPVLGKAGTDLDGLLICPIARTGESYAGTILALDTQTGETVWETAMGSYAWSSPVAIYTDDGTGYFVLCDSSGNMMLYRGATGEKLDSISLGSNVEASPVAFNDILVVGTRGQRVFGVRIS